MSNALFDEELKAVLLVSPVGRAVVQKKCVGTKASDGVAQQIVVANIAPGRVPENSSKHGVQEVLPVVLLNIEEAAELLRAAQSGKLTSKHHVDEVHVGLRVVGLLGSLQNGQVSLSRLVVDKANVVGRHDAER